MQNGNGVLASVTLGDVDLQSWVYDLALFAQVYHHDTVLVFRLCCYCT